MQRIWIAAIVFTVSTAAFAESCTDRANACMRNNGKQEVCFGPAFAGCKKTGQYVGPYSGKSFPASERK